MNFAGKAALVTGAAGGIGAAIVEAFLRAGASVAAFDLDSRGLASLAPHPALLTITGDVTCEADVERAVSRTAGQFGSLDILVSNAGLEITGPIPTYTSEQWDRQLAVNLKAAFLFARHAIPYMRRRGGAIINISSVHATVSYPLNAAYDASKAGLVAFTRTLALDHGRDGIRANSICPGYIDTPMLNKALDELPDRAEAERGILAAHPTGRIGRPADIANAVLFLASEEASFITGTSLTVDGGMTISGH